MMIGPGCGTAQEFLGKGWWVMRDSNSLRIVKNDALRVHSKVRTH